jgi:hypothetical protein
MLFASTLGEHFVFGVLSAFVMAALIIRAIGSIDNDGEIKKTASERVATMIERWTK